MATTDSFVETFAEAESRERRVGIAEWAVTTTGEQLVTEGLGSCLGIALFDDRAGVAGLIHVKLPTPDDHERASRATFADTGIDLLIEEMEREGASRHRLEAKLAGGSAMFDFSERTGLGTRNVEQARERLSALSIPVVGTDVGGDRSRSLRFDGTSGELTVVFSSTESTTI